ncbi:MAG TPA: PilZ domain-containing protein [Candidatus Baltobacteraceae bacterium]|nr:PilZ domain-containing protein [Candidatus Baltobacteraceae bacterium]
MMTEAISAFTAREKNERRRYTRRRDTFKVWCALGTKWVSAYGVDISASGLGLVVPLQIQKDEIQFRASLQDKYVMLRARKVWEQPGTFRGQIVHRYGLKITGIAADDWDMLVRYCGGEKNTDEIGLVPLARDDVARLIPFTLQHRMLGMLVQRKRLAPLDGKTPLVQYAYAGKTEREDGLLHRIAIHSRMFDAATMETRSFDTRFLFSDDASLLTIEE